MRPILKLFVLLCGPSLLFAKEVPEPIPLLYTETHDSDGILSDAELKKNQYCAAQNDPHAQVLLGKHFGKLKDYVQALKWLHKAADQHDPEAQDILSTCYYMGLGTPKDFSKAFDYARKAAEQGYIDAFAHLGVFYQMGHGVEKNVETGFQYFMKAAEQGDVIAQNNVAFCYLKGLGTTQSETLAIEWFQKAALQGENDAQLFLASVYREGTHGVKRDPDKAAEYYRMAAEQGNAVAQCELANYEATVRHNMAQAVQWYQRAAAQGDDEALEKLGSCYLAGQGVPQDGARGVELMRQAADKGNLEAQTKMGDLYLLGSFFPKDLPKAVLWYEKAANAGYAEAQNHLGAAYLNGFLPLDLARGKYWIEQSAAQDDPVGQVLLGCIYLNTPPRDAARGFELFLNAARQGNPSAQTCTGFCYWHGIGTGKDLDEAIAWLRKGYEQRSPEAVKLATDIHQLADKGNKEAQYLARAFKTPPEVTPEPDKKREDPPAEHSGTP